MLLVGICTDSCRKEYVGTLERVQIFYKQLTTINIFYQLYYGVSHIYIYMYTKKYVW